MRDVHPRFYAVSYNHLINRNCLRKAVLDQYETLSWVRIKVIKKIINFISRTTIQIAARLFREDIDIYILLLFSANSHCTYYQLFSLLIYTSHPNKCYTIIFPCLFISLFIFKHSEICAEVPYEKYLREIFVYLEYFARGWISDELAERKIALSIRTQLHNPTEAKEKNGHCNF